MSKHYVDIDDDNFYHFINKKYARYNISTKKTFRQICFPKTYELQIPQIFLSKYINPATPYRGILVYHKIGSGKTCTAINIAEQFVTKRNVVIVVPASLKGNFRSELRTKCAAQKYLTDAERKKLRKLDPASAEYKAIIRTSDAKIDKRYTIYSYNKFISLIQSDKLDLADTLLIIDEIHNMISETGTYYETLYEAIHSAPPDLRLVLMSATPIFDKPGEIALTMNLLLPADNQMPTGTDFVNMFMDIDFTENGPIYHVKNMNIFKNYARGLVSFYRGAPPFTFPRSKICFCKTTMSDTQAKVYRSVLNAETKGTKKIIVGDYINTDISNSFFIGTRIVSNIVFPNKKIGFEGFESMDSDDFELDEMLTFSPKFVRILRRINATRGTVFVYSNFKEYGGIRSFVALLEHHRWRDYADAGSGRKRFAVWSGDQSNALKDEIKAVFNNPSNADGSMIKVICGSPSAKEGVSFFRLQAVHIIEPYWNWSRMDQIIGRGIRFCSHKDMPEEKRFVRVYIYIAVHPSIKVSVDQYIMQMALQKQWINKQFETALKEAAVDCQLFKKANVYPGEEDIKCLT